MKSSINNKLQNSLCKRQPTKYFNREYQTKSSNYQPVRSKCRLFIALNKGKTISIEMKTTKKTNVYVVESQSFRLQTKNQLKEYRINKFAKCKRLDKWQEKRKNVIESTFNEYSIRNGKIIITMKYNIRYTDTVRIRNA